ncbi:MAG TPA: hypothetical protein VFL86_15285 [Burkholderiaceae bacterium]|nr:hypothetical protein [Burkholderiaceae bacterium]
MSLKSLFLTLSAAGLAVHLLTRGRGAGRRALADSAQSPNAAERLQQTHEAGAYAGVGAALPGGNAGARLFPGPPPASDPEAVTPGLPDFLRGA